MTIRRYEISDFEWSIIAPLLPNKPRGAEDRKVLNGIYWLLQTGSHSECTKLRLSPEVKKFVPLSLRTLLTVT
jgi:transposase